jgi:hypothetical protein
VRVSARSFALQSLLLERCVGLGSRPSIPSV